MGADPREALDNMQRIAGDDPRVEGAVPEIRRLDDQRIALPATARISHPQPNVLADMWAAVQGNEAHVADLLVEDRDIARSLHDLVVHVAEGRKHRQDAARETTRIQ